LVLNPGSQHGVPALCSVLRRITDARGVPRRTRLRRQGLDGHPPATTELGGELFRGHAAQELLLGVVPPPLGCNSLRWIGPGSL